MKKHAWLAILTALVLLIGSTATVYAEKLPPFGFGQIGLTAVALYDGLPVHKEPDVSSEVVTTLQFRDLIIVTEQSDGWVRCVLGDSEDSLSGWVETEYIIVDPAWYRTDTATPVYAWNDTAAPRIALLDANTVIMDPDTFLPILKEEGEWILVSMRSGLGWIHAGCARQDGDRFETIIMLEGMEETVRYEHVANDTIGFEMEYEYETFTRRSETDCECFAAVGEDADHPVNYLEVTRDPADAETAVASIAKTLSEDYVVTSEPSALDSVGSCTRIDAISKDSQRSDNTLQTVYVIPAGDGCVIATAHYTVESAEGFGARFDRMINTLALIDGQR